MPRLPKRIGLSARWLSQRLGGGAAHVGLREMLTLAVSRPWQARAREFVVRVDPPAADGLEAVWLKGCERPLWWPAEIEEHMLYQLISEQFDPINWHYYQMPETRLTPDDVVVDCGASEGLFSFLAAPVARQVFAVEPLPRFLQCLEKTFAAEPKVSLVHAALGEQSGVARITPGGVGTRLSADGAVEVPLRTLDELFLERTPAVTYIKADLEGFELPMLRGAAGLIARHLPRLTLTTYHAEKDADQMEAWLREASGGRYRFRRRGLTDGGFPVMLHVWAPGASV